MKARDIHKEGKWIEKKKQKPQNKPQTRHSAHILRQRADGMCSTENLTQTAGGSYKAYVNSICLSVRTMSYE